MKAVVYHGPFQVAVEEVPEPRLEADTDAILEVELAAICGSDLHIYQGKIAGVLPGTVLGHEFVGRIVEKGPLVPFALGERVVGSFQVACGDCPACRKEQYFACLRGGIYGFGLALGNLQEAQAERVRVPFAHKSLFPIEDLPAEEAILAGDILTTAYGGEALPHPGDERGRGGLRPRGPSRPDGGPRPGGGPGLRHRPGSLPPGKGPGAGEPPHPPPGRGPHQPGAPGHGGPGGGPGGGGRGRGRGGPEDRPETGGPRGVVSSLGVPTAERLDYPWLAAFSRGITLRSALANIPRYITEVLALQKVGRLKGRFVFSHRLPLKEAAEGYRLFHERQATKVALVP